jgi:glutamate--cysteine ligase
MNDEIDKLINVFGRKYIEALAVLKNRGQRSYGFEYEFLPARVMAPEDVQAVSRLLLESGFSAGKDVFYAANGMGVAFEPGGQIEYCSPPLYAHEDSAFDGLLEFIRQTNAMIREQLGIEYIGTDFMPDRAKAPLCLSADRYVKLHERLARVDARGLEMMKSTASIHLHVVISDFDEILPLFNLLCRLSAADDFKMSVQRKDIWMHTDACRCGTPPCCFEKLTSSDSLIRRLIHFALHADVLGEDVPFTDSSDLSFNAFLYHMTTLFTDVRFNLKGPTLELRTMDSMPLERFRRRWHLFVSLLEER